MRPADNTPFYRQCFVTAAVCGHVIGLSCAIGYPGVLLPQLQQPDSLIPVTQSTASWIASAMAILMLLGNFLSPLIIDRGGRKLALYVVAIPVLAGWITIMLGTNFVMLFIGRMLHGLSFGMNMPLRSVLIGEYTSPKNRGAFLTMVSLSHTFGLLFLHVVGYFLSWQMTALACMIFSFLSLVMTVYCPESPSYLASKGSYEDSRKAFKWLRGDTEDDELEKMILAREKFEESAITYNRYDFRKKEFYKPIVLMIHAYALMEFAGGAIMSAYFVVILQGILGTSSNAYFWMILLDVQRLISSFIAVYFIKKYKRRTIMFAVGPLNAVTLFAIASYVFAKSRGILPFDSLWIPVILINLKMFTLATGIFPLPTVLAGEVFLLEYRSVGSSISVLSTATFSFVAMKTFPSLSHSITLAGAYFLYSAIIVYILVVMWFLLPETKSKTLQEIEDEYRGIPTTPIEETLPLSSKDTLTN